MTYTECTKCGRTVHDHVSHTCEVLSRAFDPVNRPEHYTRGTIECIDYIVDKKMDYLEGNVVKYITRYKDKNGVEDLKKAQFYLNRLIKETTKKGE